MDLRDAFLGAPQTIASPLGPLLLGVVDASFPGVAAGISRLLFRSINDGRASNGGHLPDWLVADIEKNYISPEKVATLWAPFGHRFVVVYENEIIGTVHITKTHDTIFTIDRVRLNVSARDYPDFKPDRHHHLVNLSVKHELRRARIATLMLDGILEKFRDRFDGDGLWVRGDPPWHIGLVGLGFVHDPSMDVFLPGTVERALDLPHERFNELHACTCRVDRPNRPEALAQRARWMKEKKLQYVSFTRAFESSIARARPKIEGLLDRDVAVREQYASDYGRIVRVVPEAVARPRDATELAAVLAHASARATSVAFRGAGQSGDGRSSSDGIVVSLERLARIISVDEGAMPSVTVEAGATWRALVNAVVPRGLMPPVVTGWLGATIGGTLATGGFSKGSLAHGFQTDHVSALEVVTGDGRIVECSAKQAAWLFESVLGGLGAFGAITRATIPLVRASPFVEVGREEARVEDLLSALERAISSGAWHVTSFADGARFVIVSAHLRDEERPEHVPLLAYLDPARDETPKTQSLFFHAFVSRTALPSYAERAVALLDLSGGDALQVIPVKGSATRPTSLHRCIDEEVVYAVCIVRSVGGRDHARLEREGRSLIEHGTAYVAGALPPDWEKHLGATGPTIASRKRLADPAEILGKHLGLSGPRKT